MKIILAALLLASPTLAHAAAPQGPLADVGFLVGNWKSGVGKVADTGGTSVGTSRITLEADGKTLLRRDRTQTFNKVGEPAGAFSQIMLIYPEGGTLRADYGDGEGHVIHYTAASITPGKSVEFTAPAGAAPGFRLTYTLTARNALNVEFGMLPPGGAPFHEIASGTLHKAR